jgi:hypothetical protein
MIAHLLLASLAPSVEPPAPSAAASLGLGLGAVSFEDTEVEPEAEVPDSGDPDVEAVPLTAGYEKSSVSGAFIRSQDGEFELKIGAYTQIRYNANWRDAPAMPADQEDFERGWSVNRTRIFLTGRYTERFNYHFRINYNDSFDPELLVAYAEPVFKDGWSMRIGKQFFALSREDWQFAQDVLTTEFSPNDFTFAIGTSTGIQAHRQAEDRRYWFGLSNGAFGGRQEFPSPDASDIALTGRWEEQLQGDDWSVWDDQVGRPGREHGLLLGFAPAYQYRGKQASTFPDQAGQLNADLSLNGDGHQSMLAGSATWRDPDVGSPYWNYGLLLQSGWFFTERDQLYGRYDLVSPGDQPGNLEVFHSLTAGVSHFPFHWTNRWKLTFEACHAFEALDDTIVAPSGSLGLLPSTGPQTYLRLQLQFGF